MKRFGLRKVIEPNRRGRSTSERLDDDRLALVYARSMVFRAKHLELEISKFFYLRAPWLGVIYIGPDAGHGCIIRYSP